MKSGDLVVSKVDAFRKRSGELVFLNRNLNLDKELLIVLNIEIFPTVYCVTFYSSRHGMISRVIHETIHNFDVLVL